MNFLFPDLNHDTFPAYSKKYGITSETFGNFLCDLFDEWRKDNNSLIDNVCKSCYFDSDKKEEDYPNFLIYGNGRLTPEDNLPMTVKGFAESDINIDTHSMSQFLHLPIFNKRKLLLEHTPPDCYDCEWRNICKGGRCILVTRYSSKHGFDKPSVYCGSLKKVYAHTASYMVKDYNVPRNIFRSVN